MDSTESIWSRGRTDTVTAAKSFPFIILEVGGSALAGVISENPWVALIYFFGLLVGLHICAVVTAPVRQRDEERAAHIETKKKLEVCHPDESQDELRNPTMSINFDSHFSSLEAASAMEAMNRTLLLVRNLNDEDFDRQSAFAECSEIVDLSAASGATSGLEAQQLDSAFAECVRHRVEAMEFLRKNDHPLSVSFIHPATKMTGPLLQEAARQKIFHIRRRDFDLGAIYELGRAAGVQIGLLEHIDFQDIF